MTTPRPGGVAMRTAVDVAAIRERLDRRPGHQAEIAYEYDRPTMQSLVCARCGCDWPCPIADVAALLAEVARLRAALEAGRGG